MIVVLSGTNRPENRTSRVAQFAASILRRLGREAEILDLRDLPPKIFDSASYAEKPPEFEPFQQAILTAEGILTVLPEYNGSFPGVLKYFLDMLRFPESLVGKPAAFIGVAAGEWGGLRAVEQMEMIFQYRSAHLFGKRVFLKGIHTLLDDRGELKDPALRARVEGMVSGFAGFCDAVRAAARGTEDPRDSR